MSKIIINFSDRAKEYNPQIIKDMLEYGNQQKHIVEKIDIERITSECNRKIKEMKLEEISESMFYRTIQYVLASNKYLDEAELYKCLADSMEDNEQRR